MKQPDLELFIKHLEVKLKMLKHQGKTDIEDLRGVSACLNAKRQDSGDKPSQVSSSSARTIFSLPTWGQPPSDSQPQTPSPESFWSKRPRNDGK